VSIRDNTLQSLALYDGGHNLRVAAFPPFPPKNQNAPPPPGAPSKRNIPAGHPFDPKALKPLSKALYASSVALGNALAAYREFSRVKSATVSPDGMLGGRGYVMGIRDIRQKMYDACESMSAIADTLHDEINAPHWKPKLALLDENDAEDVERFVEESQDILENPENKAEEEIEEIEEANDGKKKKKKKKAPQEEEETASETPEGGDQTEEDQAQPQPQMKEASVNGPADLLRTAKELESMVRDAACEGGCSCGGPRVEHLDPEGGPGPQGSWTEDDAPPADNWDADEGRPGPDDYAYQSQWENETTTASDESDAWAKEADGSTMPDESMDNTETEAWDFGLGFGAKGQGAGNYANPQDDDKDGVWGPRSQLPGVPDQSSGDTSTQTESAINRKAFTTREEAESWIWTKSREYGSRLAFMGSDEYKEAYGGIAELYAESVTPGDAAGPPARTDYYDGPKDNLVQAESDEWATSVLPGEAPADVDHEVVDISDTMYVHEDTATPYDPYDDKSDWPQATE